MKVLVVYYSNSGNNKYLAEKIAKKTNGDIQSIEPRLNAVPFVMLFSVSKISMGIKPIRYKVKEYDRVVVCGPIYMGLLISPLRAFISKYKRDIKKLFFVTCCGSDDTQKDTRFGYSRVFQKVKNIIKNSYGGSEAFPISLALPEEKRKDQDAIMKTRLSDSNFNDELQTKLENVIQKISA